MAWTLKEICEKFRVFYSGNGELIVTQVCGLDQFVAGGIVFVEKVQGLSEISLSDQMVAIVPLGVEAGKHNVIFAADPVALHVQVTSLLHPPPPASEKIHPTAVVDETVVLGEGVTLDAHVVLYPHVSIGAHSILRAGTVVMDHSSVGENCLLHPHVSLRENCQIGHRVILHSGTVIGSDGYGYFQREGIHHKIPQIGGVVIEDDVEIGANCTIDRARFSQTRIGKGSKLDNQVHIAHNVEVGDHALLTAQVGIAGSVRTGRHLVMGGQSGISGHLNLGHRVTLLARALATKNIHDGSVIGGNPGRDAKKWKATHALTQRLASLFDRVKRLEAQMKSSSH